MFGGGMLACVGSPVESVVGVGCRCIVGLALELKLSICAVIAAVISALNSAFCLASSVAMSLRVNGAVEE